MPVMTQEQGKFIKPMIKSLLGALLQDNAKLRQELSRTKQGPVKDKQETPDETLGR